MIAMAPLLRDYTDAILYLLDYMVGIDEYLDPKESELFVRRVFSLWPEDFARVQEKIEWIAQLWKEHDRETLLNEACALLRQHGTVSHDVALLRGMAAVDGRIDPREQALFDRICHQLGISSQTLSIEA